MTILEIEHHDDEAMSAGTKRFYFPATLWSQCPFCGDLVALRGSENYLMGATFNEPTDADFYHLEEFTGEDHSWTEPIILRVRIEPAT